MASYCMSWCDFLPILAHTKTSYFPIISPPVTLQLLMSKLVLPSGSVLSAWHKEPLVISLWHSAIASSILPFWGQSATGRGRKTHSSIAIHDKMLYWYLYEIIKTFPPLNLHTDIYVLPLCSSILTVCLRWFVDFSGMSLISVNRRISIGGFSETKKENSYY